MGLGGGAGDQQVVAGRDDSFRNRGNLLGSFPRTEHDLGEALPDTAMVIDAGEPQVFERRLAQILKELVVRAVRGNCARLHVVQQRAELQAIHRAK